MRAVGSGYTISLTGRRVPSPVGEEGPHTAAWLSASLVVEEVEDVEERQTVSIVAQLALPKDVAKALGSGRFKVKLELERDE